MKSKFALLGLLASVPAAHCVLAQGHSHYKPIPPTPTRTVVPGPPVLLNISRLPNTVEVTITAEATRLSLIPGALTPSYAYNGRVPGPTLDVYEGDKVIVHFVNRLPMPTTIHWHGLHIPNTSDGSPYHPVNPGETFDYIFTPEKGSAGTYWYHPHPDQSTGFQIAHGLFGSMVIRAHDDPLPRGITERIIVLSDNRLKADGTVDIQDPSTPQGNFDLSNGREGNILQVNGQVMPTITIRSGEVQLWRVINASAARVYRLALPEQTMLHVGNDGGLFERPVEVKDILIANSERVMLLVRGIGAPGSATVLQTLPYDRYVPQTKPEGWDKPRDLLKLQYAAKPPMTPVAIPAVLRRIPAIDTLTASRRRVFVLQQGFINGKPHDMYRVDETAKLGDVEIWQIENLVGMDHPFHLHGFQFQVIDRDGVPEPFRSWKDTVNLPKHSTARFIVRLSDFAGKWMYHCHILDHEDHGMMGVLELK
ncbi:MAG TPA: multicopper oxidase family protein [Gemmatimonadaceae bacterium]|nr:multicopper oxidase family protein [Gemmatimonadaceae bacterium]